MREAIFNTELVSSLKDQGAWAYKIADSPTSWTSHLTRFTAEKPCDIIGLYHSIGFLIESKQIKKWEAFGKTQMRPSQVKNLTEAVEKNNLAYVFLNVRINAVKGDQRHVNRLIIFDWREWGAKFREGTIKKMELASMPYVEGKTVDKKMRFNLTGFLGEIGGHKRRS